MKMLVLSLFDTKTGSYGQPFLFNHIAAAARALTDLVNDPSTLPAKYPADYQLHQLAVWDDQNGVFDQQLVNHGSLTAFVREPAPKLPLFDRQAPVSPVEG